MQKPLNSIECSDGTRSKQPICLQVRDGLVEATHSDFVKPFSFTSLIK